MCVCVIRICGVYVRKYGSHSCSADPQHLSDKHDAEYSNKCIWHNNGKQVAQLWQGEHAKLDTFSINVQRYSQNHAQNWIFGPPYGGIRGNISTI